MSTGRRHRSSGFSLIEFMVAVVLGLILVAGAASIYLASKRSYVEVEQVASLSENGRFVLQLFADSLRHVGFFGAADVNDIVADGSLGTPLDDCTGEAEAYSLDDFLFATVATGADFDCIDDSVIGTHILIIKSLQPQPFYDADPEDPNAPLDGVIDFPDDLSGTATYAVVNSETGTLMDGADAAALDVSEGGPLARAIAWPYRMEVFYVRDNPVPTLSRKVLSWNGGAMAIRTEELVEGVEDIRFRFGVDSDNDGNVDIFTNPADTAGNWDRVEAIQAFVLLRSPTPDFQYANTKSYDLGGEIITVDDNFRRLMLQSSISLRNPTLTIRGGL